MRKLLYTFVLSVIGLSGYAQTWSAGSGVLYTNPTQDIVHLSFIEKNSDVCLSVCDVIGKELFQQIIKSDNCDVDLSSYNAGLYLFRIASDKYNHTFKIIKY